MIFKQNYFLSLDLQYSALVRQTLWCHKCSFENPSSTACTFPGTLSFLTVNRSPGNDAATNTPQEPGVYDSHILNLFVLPPHCACCAAVFTPSHWEPRDDSKYLSKHNSSESLLFLEVPGMLCSSKNVALKKKKGKEKKKKKACI